MDAKLAAIYGTGDQPEAEDDLEKRAAAELLVKLAEEQGIDLSQYTDEQVLAAMNQLYKTAAESCDEDKKADGEEKTSEGEPPFFAKKESKEESKESKETKDEGESKEGAGDESRPESGESKDDKEGKESSESAEKVAEADFLGRVMAHAMVNEMRQIEKAASAQAEGQEKDAGKMDFLKNLGAKAKGVGAKASTAAKGFAKKHDKAIAGGAGMAVGGTVGLAAERAIHRKDYRKAAKEDAAEKKGSADVSALDQLAQQRAFEMAKEAGWVDEQGNLIAPPEAQAEEKQASALDVVVEQRALELLQENGYPVEWNK